MRVGLGRGRRLGCGPTCPPGAVVRPPPPGGAHRYGGDCHGGGLCCGGVRVPVGPLRSPPAFDGHRVSRFRSGATGQVTDPGRCAPTRASIPTAAPGTSTSAPSESQVEGPGIPGTVTYQSDGCWVWRLDYSDSHWQNVTFCPRDGNLVEVVGPAGIDGIRSVGHRRYWSFSVRPRSPCRLCCGWDSSPPFPARAPATPS